MKEAQKTWVATKKKNLRKYRVLIGWIPIFIFQIYAGYTGSFSLILWSLGCAIIYAASWIIYLNYRIRKQLRKIKMAYMLDRKEGKSE